MIAVPLRPPRELCMSRDTSAIRSSPLSTPNNVAAVLRVDSLPLFTLQPPEIYFYI